MYDTVRLTLEGQGVVHPLKHLRKRFPTFEPCRDVFYERDGLQGNIGNFRINATDISFSITGSLAKFLFGQNCSSLDLDTTRDALQALSDLVSLDLNHAHVYRLDFGVVIAVKYPVPCYTQLLGKLGRRQKSIMYDGHSVRYDSENRVFAIYDKLREVKSNYNPGMPTLFQMALGDLREDVHLIRVEDRYLRKLKLTVSGGTLIVGKDLYSQAFFVKRCKELYASWRQVEQYPEPVFPYTISAAKVKSLEKDLIAMGIQATGGMGSAIEMIHSLYLQGNLTYHQKHRMKNRVRKNAMESGLWRESPLMIELDEQIRMALAHYL